MSWFSWTKQQEKGFTLTSFGYYQQKDVLGAAHELFSELELNAAIKKRLDDTGKTATGGYLCVADSLGAPILITRIGVSPPEKLAGRLAFCQEKASRLASHPAHLLSRQSANEAEEKYPGAVRAHEVILSFSGLPGHLDELYMLILAVRMGRMSAAAARATLATYPNDYATEEVVRTFLADY